MLPTILITIVSFLLKICISSPVYSMQPAYIIANIGTTGRNIRNLPCISRKSNEKGVCMFAIDCLKANGTHLGTCIDRFYFGSCCHIEPVHDIVGNTIDTAIIPSRQPPSRLSTTGTTTQTPISSKVDKITESLTTNATMTKTTIAAFISSSVATTTTTTTTTRPTTTTRRRVTTTTPAPKTTRTRTTAKPIQTFGEKLTKPSTRSPKPTIAHIQQQTETTTEIPYKLTTFQTVEENTVHGDNSITQKPFRVTTTPKTTTYITSKSTASSKPSATSSASLKPKPTIKPRPPGITTSKPLKITKPSYKPISISTRIPTKPNKTSITVKPIKTTTTKKPSVTKTTSRITTTRATTTTTTKRPPVVTKTPIAAAYTRPKTTTTIKPSTTSATTRQPSTSTTTAKTHTTKTTTAAPTTAANISTTTQSNELPLVSSVLESVNGNPATNEIEQVKPLQPPPTTEETNKPSLVTWAAVVNEEAISKPSTTLNQDWMPLTTPDGWVLLPSLSTLLPGGTASTTTTTTTTTGAPLLSSTAASSSTNAALNITTETTATVEHNETTSERPLQVNSTSTTITTAPFNYSTETSNFTVGNVTTTMSSTEALPVTTSTITNLTDVPSTTELSGVNTSDFTDVCGRRMYPEARIVGGQSATFGKWPWQISLRQWRTSTYLHKCGAALLNENWAITAAHCVDNVPPSDLLLRLGEHDLSTDNEPFIHQERRVQIVASHPQFDPRTFEYDLALLRFYEPVQFKPNIIPVCVPDTDENFVGRTAYVTGWGRLYEDGPLPSVLQEVAVPVINNTVCESMYRSAGYIEHIPHIFICAGWRRGGFDSCEGDSGGPMVIQRADKRFLLAGVISWGIGCAEPNQPGVYTRISEFRDWINQILQF